MTHAQEPQDEGLLDREARAWVSRLISGDATVAELEAAKLWRDQSPLHEAAFVRAARLWDRLGPAGRRVLEGTDYAANAFGRAASPISRRMLIGATGAAAASTAAYLLLFPPFDLWPSFSELRADYRTATGEQRQIETSNGASVKMNTATSLNLRSTAQGAVRIELISGEMAITMASGGKGSIVVAAGDGRSTATNARFNIRYVGAAVCVTCFAGSVEVDAGSQVLDLQARQQVNYTGHEISEPVVIDSAAVNAWESGLLIFHGTPLAEVLAEINRYRPGRIVLLNAELGRQPVNARFHIARIDDIMMLVQRVFGARVEKLPGGLVFLS